jgi:hypothetical protein
VCVCVYMCARACSVSERFVCGVCSPVNCIHWVSESQLSLLETTMGSMERIDVWQLMTGGGRAVNVFVVRVEPNPWFASSDQSITECL